MSNVEKQLKDLADKAYKQKIKTEKSAIEKRYLKDKKLLEEIPEIVKSRLVYKEIGDYNKKYIVVTEEMLLADYTNEPKNSWSHGTKMETYGEYFTISVNGHRYYHLGQLFKTYKEDVENSIKMNSYERDKLYEKRDALKNLEEQEPKIKQMMEEFIALEESKVVEEY